MTLNDLIAECHATELSFVGSAAIQAAIDTRKADKEKQAAVAVGGLLGTFECALKDNVRVLRNIREQEKAQQAMVEKIDRAFRFFGETGNPFPMFLATGRTAQGHSFASTLGFETPKADSDAWKIPADWKPKAEDTKL